MNSSASHLLSARIIVWTHYLAQKFLLN
jgi:hypothetical protein